ncbi:MAG: serine--tRNA ligase [Nitrospinota bacterium]
MLDIRQVREESEGLRAALARRGSAPDFTPILERDARRRFLITEVQGLRARQKDLSRQIGELKRLGQEAETPMGEVRDMGERIAGLERQIREEEEGLRRLMLEIPNRPHASVLDGADERFNREVRRWGVSRTFDFDVLDHVVLGERLGILDLARAAKIAGARFPLMMGPGAALERALLNFMMDLHTRRHGYSEVLPPFLVNAESLIGTGQLPKFEEDLFRIGGDGFYLAPTAEVPVTNVHRGEILAERVLPIRYVAFTPCFRREAGAYGKDTRGLIRQHQFDKVELVKFTTPESSYDELESLTRDAEEVLQRLEIPYRVVALCAGDLGFAAAKTYDIEVWLPSKKGYLEVSSCSNFEDFQARRTGIRYRGPDGKTAFVHTLNGSGLAIGRTVVALLENGQQQDGSVAVPEVLRPYLGGMEAITRVKAPWLSKGQPEAKGESGGGDRDRRERGDRRQGERKAGPGGPTKSRADERESRQPQPAAPGESREEGKPRPSGQEGSQAPEAVPPGVQAGGMENLPDGS